jgi:hypothetical protein
MVSARPFQFHSSAAAFVSIASLAASLSTLTAFASVPAGYPGAPYGAVQQIPGRVFLSDFDQGPKEGTWHDYETKNPWACKVRDSTGVGLQIMGAGGDKGDTKEADSLVKARMGKCYLAETNQGDWTKYTVKIKQAGVYNLSYLSAAQKTDIPFVAVSLLGAKDSVGTGKVTLPLTTYFHAWVYTRNLSQLTLDSGTQVLRFDIVGNGPMNIDYIDFDFTGAAGIGKSGMEAGPSGGLALLRANRSGDGTLELEVNATGGGPVEVSLYGASGNLLAKTPSADVRAGSNRIRIGSASLPSGLVFVRMRRGTATLMARTLVVP